jgi:hypothetical protein
MEQKEKKIDDLEGENKNNGFKRGQEWGAVRRMIPKKEDQ